MKLSKFGKNNNLKKFTMINKKVRIKTKTIETDVLIVDKRLRKKKKN